MAISVDTASNVLLTLRNLNTSQGAPIQSGTGAGNSSAGGDLLSVLNASAGGDPLGGAIQGLSRAATVSDIAVAAGGAVAGLLGQLQQDAAQAADPSTDPTTRQGLNTDYRSLLGQIQAAVQSAGFDGVNLVDGSTAAAARFSIGPDGATASLSGQDLSLGGAVVTVASTSSIGTPSAAAAALSDITQSLSNLKAALDQLTAQADSITAHGGLLAQAAGQGGGGSNLDADGARLQALQIQQQLAGSDVSIANQAPQLVLALFR